MRVHVPIPVGDSVQPDFHLVPLAGVKPDFHEPHQLPCRPRHLRSEVAPIDLHDLGATPITAVPQPHGYLLRFDVDAFPHHVAVTQAVAERERRRDLVGVVVPVPDEHTLLV